MRNRATRQCTSGALSRLTPSPGFSRTAKHSHADAQADIAYWYRQDTWDGFRGEPVWPVQSPEQLH